MDENKIEISIIDILKKNFSENEAFIHSFPDDPQYEDGVINYTMTHPKCDILVDCDDIDFGSATISDQYGSVRIEITIFMRKRKGDEGAKSICKKIREILTGSIIEGNRPIPIEQRKLFYDGEVWCYGQHYLFETYFSFGE